MRMSLHGSTSKIFKLELRECEEQRFFHEALKRNPKMPGPLFGLAKIYMQQEKYREALPAIDSAVHLATDNQSGHFVRGPVLARLGRPDEAQAEFAIAKKMVNADLGK